MVKQKKVADTEMMAREGGDEAEQGGRARRRDRGEKVERAIGVDRGRVTAVVSALAQTSQ